MLGNNRDCLSPVTYIPGNEEQVSFCKQHLHLKLRHFDTTPFRSQVEAITPLGLEKLRAVNNDLAELDALAGRDMAGDDVDASTEAEHEACVCPIKDEVAASQQHLARG